MTSEARILNQIAAKATSEAAAQTLAAGHSITVQRENKIVTVHPDGRTDVIADLTPPDNSSKGGR